MIFLLLRLHPVYYSVHLVFASTCSHHSVVPSHSDFINMASAKDFKIVLAGQFGTGKTTFATRVKSAKSDSKEIKALKTTQYPVTLQTSAGSVTLRLFDTNLHAKGGIPDDGFFRTADAAIVFFDLTKEASYTAMEEWYDAVVKANGRKGSEPLPVIVVGTKADDIKGRDIKPEAIEFPRKKELPYREISSNANYGVKELLLDVCRSLLGDSVQLTDEVDLDKPKIDKIDEEQLAKLFSEYEKASK
ncbi:putative GTP-binding nuclear protein GSP2/CNR2 (putative) [Pseudozyma hubeiensis]|nr:putative GTP-binding nuclear protein GSP2/CNR2 (putative) [Pseudozyma hubeiensis]